MANIIKQLPSKSEEILKASFEDLITFGKVFLSGDFMKSKTPAFHYEIGKELLSDSNKPCAIIVPRGHAKTTLIKASIIHNFCFAKKAKEWGFSDEEMNYFFGWVSSNRKKSENNVAYVRLHLEFNEKIKYYFGKNGSSLKGSRWNQEDISTVYDDRLLSSSNLTSMRGDTLATIHAGALRYSKVFVDDAENEENTRTQSSRDKIVENIMNGILPAIEKKQKGCRLFLIETPVHWDAFAQNILDKWAKVQKEGQEAMDEFSWKVITYPASNPDGTVLWPGFMDKETLETIKRSYIDSPKGVDGYYQEYELQVQSGENALFTKKHIKYHDGTYQRHNGRNFIVINNEYREVNTFLGCDPATDIDTKHSDYSVIMVIGVDKDDNVFVLDYERHRSIPTLGIRNDNGELDGKKGVVDYIFDLYEKYNCKYGVVEDVAMNRSIFNDLNREKKRSGKHNINIIPEKPGGLNKINRIYTGLSSRFSNGRVYVRESQFDLINEIIKFGPKMAHDDTIETLYYAALRAFPISKEITLDGEYIGKSKQYKKPKPWTIA